jgi:hypothetical protein
MGRFGKDTRKSREETGRFGGDIRRSDRCGMWILQNYRKIRENPKKNLVHDRYRKIRDERVTQDTRSFMDKTGRFGGDTGRHWRYKRDTRSFMGDTGRTEEDIRKFGMDICRKYTEIKDGRSRGDIERSGMTESRGDTERCMKNTGKSEDQG